MEEIWEGIIYQGKDFSEFYEVSNNGDIRNTKTKIIKKFTLSKTGYLQFIGGLGSRTKRKTFRVHRCVVETFLPRVEQKLQINHKDGNKFNNCLDNLEWCTAKENVQHAWDMGLCDKDAISGVNNSNSKLVLEDIVFIKENYKPYDKNFGTRGLAKRFNVSHQILSSLLMGKTYKNI